MRYNKIVVPSYVDGPGERVALFMQGCTIRCPGCQNPHLWDFHGGREGDPFDLAVKLHAEQLPVTITGGEPFDQANALYKLLHWLRTLSPDVHIIVYSGRTLFQLLNRAHDHPAILQALALVDVLVDGPFIQDQDDDRLQYRGSRNQRVIDMPATLRELAGKVLFYSGPITLDWDTPEVILTPAGDILGAAGVVDELFADGVATRPTRRCGEPA